MQFVEMLSAGALLCCGVGTLFRELALFDKQPMKSQTSRSVNYYDLGEDCYVIDYLHPEAQYAGNLLYYGLIDAVRELLA